MSTSHGSATVIGRSVPVHATPVHELTPTIDPDTETYTERIERVEKLTRPVLRTPESTRDAETRCASGDFITLSVVYDSIFEGVYDVLPPALRRPALDAKAVAHRDMQRLHISTLAITENPLAQGADVDDPIVKHRNPISQLIVTDLLKIRDGRDAEAIPLGNITVVQAVETVWLYLFATVLVPAKSLIGTAPDLGSPFDDTRADFLAPYLTYNWLLSAFILTSDFGLRNLYQRTIVSLLNQCVARVTDEQKALAGKPSDSVRFDIPISPMVRELSRHIALADTETCTPIARLTLGRVLAYVSEQAQLNAPRDAARIRAETSRILRIMRGIRIHHNLIPLDPAEQRSVGELSASLFGSLIPIFGGAPLDILLGIGHNIGHGQDPWETVSLDELTVSKPITAAHHAYRLGLHFISLVGNMLEPRILGDSPLRPTRLLVTALGLPMTYGLVTAHNVLRTVCLRVDDASGTGLGAEVHRRASGPVTTKSVPPNSDPPESTSSRFTPPRSTPRRSTPQGSTPQGSTPQGSISEGSTPQRSRVTSSPAPKQSTVPFPR
ncbi:hypothetical protein [Gordonia jinghuaiqii]|uniref:hypothetical protein n=1 Tax=Gordonia jinghuaiqii TaxID=2758710 RepID=UPI001FCFB2FF|nr:hypothetical protein [Gordonia jinghuaiqii]